MPADYRQLLDCTLEEQYDRLFTIESVLSFQVTILKALAGHPGGYLSVADLKRAVSILICSGPDWTHRTKCLLARAPGLDIFSQSLVVRDTQGWQITAAGRALLAAIEEPAASLVTEEVSSVLADQPLFSTSAPLLANPVGRRDRKSRRRRRVGRPAA